MATGKRYYWLKLYKEFMTGNEIDFLMNQKNGAKYVVLYQMLCLSTINTRGACAYNIGEAIIPYDIDKIQRDTKYFDRDTVIVALELFKKLGWVYEQDNGALQISNFDEIVGSETDWAQKKARQRLAGGDNVPEMSLAMSPEMSPQRKSIEERGKSTKEDTQSFTHTAHVGAREKEGGLPSEEGGLPTDEQKKRLQQTYLGGTLGQGLVMMSPEQFDALCGELSNAELVKYFEIITDCEKTGKHFRKKTHYQAILDMAREDRRV